MTKRSLGSIVAGFALALVSAAGCSSETSTPSDAGAAPSTKPSDASVGDGDIAVQCMAVTSTFEECRGCCKAPYPDGYNQLINILRTCVCKTENCGTECEATVCANGKAQLGDACEVCLDGLPPDAGGDGGAGAQDTCSDEVLANCSNDAVCLPYLGCLVNACQAKPFVGSASGGLVTYHLL